MIWRRHVDQIDSDTGKTPDLNKPHDTVPEILPPDPVVPVSLPAKSEQAVPSSETPTPAESPLKASPKVLDRHYPSRNCKPPDKLNL